MDTITHSISQAGQTHRTDTVHRQIADYKTGVGKQLPRMLLDLGADPPGFVPGHNFILQVTLDALHAFWWTAYSALKQMSNPAPKNAIGPQADGLRIYSRFQRDV